MPALCPAGLRESRVVKNGQLPIINEFDPDTNLDPLVMDTTPEACSCVALRQAARHLTRLYDEALAPAGIGVNQYSITATLERHGPEHLQALAERLTMDRSTLGHLLKPLAARGWVDVGVASEDRRHRVIALTAEGKAVNARARPLWAGVERRFAQAFGVEEAAALRQTLKNVALIELVGGSP